MFGNTCCRAALPASAKSAEARQALMHCPASSASLCLGGQAAFCGSPGTPIGRSPRACDSPSRGWANSDAFCLCESECFEDKNEPRFSHSRLAACRRWLLCATLVAVSGRCAGPCCSAINDSAEREDPYLYPSRVAAATEVESRSNSDLP